MRKRNRLPPLPKEPLQSIPNSTAVVRSILFNPGAIGGRLGVSVLDNGVIVEVNRRSKLNVCVGWQIFALNNYRYRTNLLQKLCDRGEPFYITLLVPESDKEIAF